MRAQLAGGESHADGAGRSCGEARSARTALAEICGIGSGHRNVADNQYRAPGVGNRFRLRTARGPDHLRAKIQARRRES